MKFVLLFQFYSLLELCGAEFWLETWGWNPRSNKRGAGEGSPGRHPPGPQLLGFARHPGPPSSSSHTRGHSPHPSAFAGTKSQARPAVWRAPVHLAPQVVTVSLTPCSWGSMPGGWTFEAQELRGQHCPRAFPLTSSWGWACWDREVTVPRVAQALQKQLRELGEQVPVTCHPGVGSPGCSPLKWDILLSKSSASPLYCGTICTTSLFAVETGSCQPAEAGLELSSPLPQLPSPWEDRCAPF